jgi:hypothetical protein
MKGKIMFEKIAKILGFEEIDTGWRKCVNMACCNEPVCLHKTIHKKNGSCDIPCVQTYETPCVRAENPTKAQH